MRRHVVHAPRRDKTTRSTMLAQNMAPTPSIDRLLSEEGRSFLSQFGKAKDLAQ
jgi:hypothetical protein